jgi:hypothetical protein
MSQNWFGCPCARTRDPSDPATLELARAYVPKAGLAGTRSPGKSPAFVN